MMHRRHQHLSLSLSLELRLSHLSVWKGTSLRYASDLEHWRANNLFLHTCTVDQMTLMGPKEFLLGAYDM